MGFDCETFPIHSIGFAAIYCVKINLRYQPMTTDITPLTALEQLCAKGKSENTLLTDISHVLGLQRNRNKSEQWKQKLRNELSQEHIKMKKKNDSSFKTRVHKLFQWD